jgi:hypothetical protein
MRPNRHSRTWSLAGGLIAAAVLAALLPLAEARAAEDGLRIVTDATYDVRPADRLVHVTINATATNTTPDTSAGRTYYTGLTFALPPGAIHIAAASEGVALPLVVREAAQTFTNVELTYHRQVFYNQRYRYRVTFDLADAGDAPDRDVRVTRSVVAFPVWAFGSSGTTGSSVSVNLPAGYTPSVEGGPLNVSRTDAGATILSATDLADPFAFFAYVSADRPGAFTETQASADLGASTEPIVIRAWDDDPTWGARMTDLMTRGIPELADLIGLPYPVHGRLRVEEAATSRLGEYAGTYNDTTELITVRYDADAVVALHEASHIWFNESLLRGRWIGEAFAEYYGVQAASALDEPGQTFELSDELLTHKIPLNDWGGVGVEDLDVEDYAYAATYHLATLIADRAHPAGLRAVWRAAHDGEMSYQPPDAAAGDAPERGVSALLDDWQRLLDLLEARTGTAYDDLWRDWVVNGDQAQLLALRSAARDDYTATLTAADDWQLPRTIRVELGAWQFSAVTEDLATARDVLTQRDEIASAAEALDLTAPTMLREQFEGGGGLESAEATATAELGTLDALRRTGAALGASPTALETVGLLGASPSIDLAAARDAYEAGELDDADARASRALAVRRDADEVGRQRVGFVGGSVLGLDLVTMAALAVRRRRRAAARRLAAAPPPPATLDE